MQGSHPVRPQAQDRAALKTTAAGLSRFARRLDLALHRHCSSRALWQGVRGALSGGAVEAAPRWMPSPWTLLFLALAPLLALPLLEGAAAWQWALLSLPVLVLAWWLEMRLLPWLRLAACGFCLMRLEHRDEGEYGDTYLAARIPDSTMGFASQSWRRVRGVEVGDIVLAVSDRNGRGLAIVPLRLEGRLPLATWVPERWQAHALPSLPRRVRQLAQEFDRACDVFVASEAPIERSRALKSAKFEVRRDPEAAWAGIAIAAEDRRQLQALAQAFAEGRGSASPGLLLHGPPGTGKTLIARALAESVDCAFFALSLPDLKAAHVGQSGENVRALWREALAQPRAVVFVDECEGVFARRGGVGTDAFSEDIVASFIAQWDGFGKQTSVWVVGATNRRELVDPAVLSRFEDQVEIGLPDGPQREQILRAHLARLGVPDAIPPRAAELTAGLSGRDIAAVARRLARTAGEDPAPVDDVALEAVTRGLRQRGGDAAGAAGWDRLVLGEGTLAELRAVAALLGNADALQRRGVGVPRGLLLYGPPGTGKTLIARTLAHETGLRFIAASTADIKQGYLGQSGQKVRELFERAREAAPSLLFIDEIDAVAARRGGQDAFVDEIVGQLLQEMDGAKLRAQHVFVLAATNRLDQLDEAVRSRLPRRIEVPLPDADGIGRLLRVLLAGKPLAFDLEQGARALAPRLAGASGRDLRDLVERAEQRAVLRALEQGDIDAVAIAPEDFMGVASSGA